MPVDVGQGRVFLWKPPMFRVYWGIYIALSVILRAAPTNPVFIRQFNNARWYAINDLFRLLFVRKC